MSMTISGKYIPLHSLVIRMTFVANKINKTNNLQNYTGQKGANAGFEKISSYVLQTSEAQYNYN